MSMFFDLFRRDPNIVYVEAGDCLFKENAESDGMMYVLLSGSADVYLNNVHLEIIQAGAIVGEMALIEHRALRSATVQAITRCGFVAINEKRFNFLVTEAPQFAIEVMRVMAQRLRATDKALDLCNN